MQVIENEVKKYIDMFGYAHLPIVYDLTNKTAGAFTYKNSTGPVKFRFNLAIAEKNLEAFLARTVPHEVAHYVDFMRNGQKMRTHPSGRRDMHGRYFKAIMQEMGVTDTSTYHAYDTSHVQTKRQRRWEYACSCTSYSIATVTHNRIQNGQERQCTKCKEVINKHNFTGKEIK